MGAYPQAIFQTSDGTFYGTATQLGKVTKGFADGTVFSLNLGLPPQR